MPDSGALILARRSLHVNAIYTGQERTRGYDSERLVRGAGRSVPLVTCKTFQDFCERRDAIEGADG